MNVVLVRPQDVSFSAYNSAEHPGLAYIAGALRKDGYKTCIVDAVIGRLTVEECAESILACDPDLVGFTVFQQSLWNTVEMARALRQRKYQGHITTGGHFATFAYQDILAEFDCIDSVVRFEGEGAACDLARMLKNGENWKNVPGLAYRQNGSGKIAYNPRPKLMNLDMLAMPARDTLGLAIANGSNYASIVSSRGCWGQCAFCTLAAMDHGWRAHSPNRVVGEIEILYRQGVNRFLFTDSNFLGAGSRGKERATKIADKIIRRRLEIAFSIYTRVDCITRDILSHLKGAGLTTVYLGIESGSQAVLDRWKKNVTLQENKDAIALVREMGLELECGFLMFDPWTTLEEALENITFLKEQEIGDYFSLVSQIEIRPGMSMSEELVQENRIMGPWWEPTYQMSADVEEYRQNLLELLAPLVPLYQMTQTKHREENCRAILNALRVRMVIIAETLLHEPSKKHEIKANSIKWAQELEAIWRWLEV